MVTVSTQASKENGGDHSFCGGSIIGSSWVLTAAHCVVKSRNVKVPNTISAESVMVVRSAAQNNVSTSQLPYNIRSPDFMMVSYGSNSKKKMKSVQVKSVHVPGAYIDSEYSGDFALLELSTPLEFDDDVKPIRISSTFISSNMSVTAAGYGSTKQNGYSPSEKLKLVKLKTGNRNVCSQHRDGFTDNNSEVICCPTFESSDTCFGDSGGPLLAATLGTQFTSSDNNNITTNSKYYENEWVLLGLTSYGNSISNNFVCASEDGAGFYTNVDYYSHLISKISGIPRSQLLSNESFQEFDIRIASKSAQTLLDQRILLLAILASLFYF
ncbi:hypothetical protein BB561_005221 [Smittium simulii]|uniref:Peptidase S1 domain-containing protein n=1 Tax=Smittium simulii TaxID=133385 RepID=A0A2T9YBH9_9FUNG|nr:hypothetical protein BB561_005221 [Smittium simulii]